MLGGRLSAELLLLGQEVFEARGGEGEGLAPQSHQVGILQPGVVVAVLDGGPGPRRENKPLWMINMACPGTKSKQIIIIIIITIVDIYIYVYIIYYQQYLIM